ncbi:MAG TPA: penicillin acylase family protein, partial [Pseudonocardiaceae bacterium]
MSRTARLFCVLTACAAVGLGVPAPASAAGTPFAVTDFCSGQCGDILPPGENGNATLADILANKLFGTAPAHTNDQLSRYGNLADNYQSLTNATIDQYFNDSSFGVPAGQVESSIQPRGDVTIVRDKATGVPH